MVLYPIGAIHPTIFIYFQKERDYPYNYNIICQLRRKGLGLGRNPLYILYIVTERGENENDLLPCFKLDKKNKNHMQKGK